MDAKNLEEQLLEVQQDLRTSLKAEQHYGDMAREHRAESSNFELSFQQREAHHRAYVQFTGQHNGQRAESARLHLELLRLRRQIQEERDMAILSNVEFLARLKRSQPYKLTASMAEGMDDMAAAGVPL